MSPRSTYIHNQQHRPPPLPLHQVTPSGGETDFVWTKNRSAPFQPDIRTAGNSNGRENFRRAREFPPGAAGSSHKADPTASAASGDRFVTKIDTRDHYLHSPMTGIPLLEVCERRGNEHVVFPAPDSIL